MLSDALRKEAYYHGEQLAQAPDILCFLRDPSYYFMRYSYHMRPVSTFLALKQGQDVVIRSLTPDDDFVGDHTDTGILVASGPGVKTRGQVESVQIVDLAPTILATFGLPVPSDMDGRVLRDYFQMLPNSPLTTQVILDSTSDERKAPHSQETAEILRRKLRTLGYNV